MKDINLKKMSKSDLQLLIEEASKEIKRPRLTREEKKFLSFFKNSNIQITDDYIYIIFGEKEISTLIPKSCLSGLSFNDLQLYKTYSVNALLGIITLKEFFESEEELLINCETKEQSDTLCKAFNKMCKTLRSGAGYLVHNDWYMYKENTCYSNQGLCTKKDVYQNKNIKIYYFEEVDLEGYDN